MGAWGSIGTPFLSERARVRAPKILAYAALAGGAMLVSPSGEVVAISGAVSELDLVGVGRRARALGGARRVISFAFGGSCIHAAPAGMGWLLCALSTMGADPAEIAARTRKASAVMALALRDGTEMPDGGGQGGGEGAPALVSAMRRSMKRD